MQMVLTREITRRNPFKLESLPWIARVYRYPFERWSSLGQQALFGAPNYLLFVLCQRFSPFKHEGVLTYSIDGQAKRIRFNALNTQFQALYRKAFAGGYEAPTTALLELICPLDGCFYDVGSNWGWFSLIIASKPGFRGEIHAFEPVLSTYADLCHVVKQASLETRIRCHQVALAARPGMAFMRLPDHFQSGLAVLEESGSAHGSATTVTTLDSFGLPPPAVIKIDVEGAEVKVLQGGSRLLAAHKPMLVFESGRSYETPSRTLRPLWFLRQAGYQFFHTGWLKKAKDMSYLCGDDGDPNPQETEVLALSPFEVETRFLRHDGMNIFACHSDRLGQLETLFQKRHFDSLTPLNV